ncbi:MAG TPA: phage tail tube protein [Thermoanaerobaculia bacterium]|nr:phage tail tube protein [Thermoanaerobaculia bacterium]
MSDAQGSFEQWLVGVETTFKTPPGTPSGSKVPVINPQIKPSVNRFYSKAFTGSSEPRPPVDGKIGVEGPVEVECSRESLGLFLKGVFGGTIVDSGTSAGYEHILTLGVQGSLFVEQGHTDISVYVLWRGMKVSSWTVNCDAEGLAQMTFQLMGAIQDDATTSSYFTGTITDRTGSSPLSYLDAVVKRDGVVVGGARKISFTLDRKLQKNIAIDGSSECRSITASDTPTLNGTAEFYFEDVNILNETLDGSNESSMEIFFPAEEAGCGLELHITTLKLKPTGPVSQGQGIVTLPAEFDGYARGTASDIPARVSTKGFETVAVVNGSNDSLVISVSGGADQTFDLGTTGNVSRSAIVTIVNATATGFLAVEKNDYIVFETTAKGAAVSIQVKASSTCGTLLGLDNSLHNGQSAKSIYAVYRNLDATIS